MTRDEARAITDRISGALEQIWDLLLEAYEGRAWSALGYPSWRAYATAEFGLSQRRAYQLLDQAWVERALREAAGCPELGISEAEARDLSPHLSEVTRAVRAAVAGQPRERTQKIAREVVTARREAVVQARRQRAAEVGEEPREQRDPEAHLKLPVPDLEQHRVNLHLLSWLYRAMDGLARMPPVCEVAAAIEWTPDVLGAVEEAAQWLDELAEKAPPPTQYPRPRRYDEECRRLEEYCANIDVAEILRTHDDVATDAEGDLDTG